MAPIEIDPEVSVELLRYRGEVLMNSTQTVVKMAGYLAKISNRITSEHKHRTL
jgi:hypothetical protein